MKTIGIDARSLLEGDVTGIGKYTYHCILAALSAGYAVRAFADHVVQIPFGLEGKIEVVHAKGRNKYLWEQVTLRRLLRQHPVDVYHATANHGLPIGYRGKAVVTIHDLIPLELPDLYRPRSMWEQLDRLMYRISLKIAVHVAESCLTVSRVSASSIQRILRPTIPVRVIYEAGEMAASTHASSPSTINHPIPYFVYFGGMEVRKNIPRLIYAFQQVRKAHPEYSLILIGRQNQYYKEKIEGMIDGESRIITPGYIDDHALMEIVRNARALVYPSLYEGFGLPILEAMSLGVPVICHQSSASAEIGSDAAVAVDCSSEDDIAHAMLKMIADNTFHASLQEAAFKRAGAFSWKSMEAAVSDVYLQCIREEKR